MNPVVVVKLSAPQIHKLSCRRDAEITTRGRQLLLVNDISSSSTTRVSTENGGAVVSRESID